MKPKAKAEGNILISLTFVILISFTAITLLTFTVAHTRIVKARTKKLMETEKMYQDLIYYLHYFREKIFNVRIQDFNQPETDYFNGTHFPDKVTTGTHLITPSFESIEFPKQDYTKTKVFTAMDVSSYLNKNNYRLYAEVTVDILSGKIPLSVFPFFLNKNVDVPVETFLKENNIINKSRKNVIVGDVETELDVSRFLLDSLKISGTVLGWREIREKVGLELSDEPIAEGIYLILDEGIVATIFIQGDIERVIFSIDSQDHMQKIRLIKETEPYEIQYKPGQDYFTCWNPLIETETMFAEKIIVNGSVWSIEQEGGAAFVASAGIVLFVSGKAVIHSNLETETGDDHFNLREIKLTTLTLTCGKEKLFEQSSGVESEIIVDTEGKTNLHTSMITSGKFTNKRAELKLSGSLYCKDLENNGTVEITHVNAAKTTGIDENYFRTVDFKYINQFLITVIEEVSHENQ